MTIKTWLEMAIHDADRRGLPALKPLLEMLAKATSALRAAEWNADASGELHTQEPASGSFDPRSPIPNSRNGR
jgi:hypothetical protein